VASIYKKAGASGAESPYWQARFRGLNGRQAWLSTRQIERRRATVVAGRWEECVELAKRRELRTRAQKIIDGIWKLTKSPATVKNTKRLINNLLAKTTSEKFQGERRIKLDAPPFRPNKLDYDL
jgi:hypothetical protein